MNAPVVHNYVALRMQWDVDCTTTLCESLTFLYINKVVDLGWHTILGLTVHCEQVN